jgi:hypothetical protein
MPHLIEIRSLTLKPGARDQFQRLYIEEALPRLQYWNSDFVAHGPSGNSYYPKFICPDHQKVSKM